MVSNLLASDDYYYISVPTGKKYERLILLAALVSNTDV